MTNDQTGAEFGPEDGVIAPVDENEPQPTFYVKETVTEKVIDSVLEDYKDEDNNDAQHYVAHESDNVTVRVFGPYVEKIADQEIQRAKDRHDGLGLAGTQDIEKVPADEHDIDTQQEPSAAAQEPVVTDVLLPNAEQAPEIAVEQPVDAPNLIPNKAAGDAPSTSVTVATVPESDQDVVDGNVTNPPYEAPSETPDADAPQATIPSAPETDPSTTDAVTTSSTEPDDETPKDDAPPVTPDAPVGQDSPVVDDSNSPAPVDASAPEVTTVQDEAPVDVPVDAPETTDVPVDAPVPAEAEPTTSDSDVTTDNATPDQAIIDSAPAVGTEGNG